MKNSATLLFSLPLVLFSALSFSAPTDTETSMRRCAAVKDSVKRLECFDGIAASAQSEADKAAAQSAASKSNDYGKWTVDIERSKLDDSTNVFVSADAKDTVRGKFGEPVRPRMIMRCMEKTTALYFSFGGLFMADSGNYGEVTFRIDQNKAFSRSLDASTNHSSLGMWSGGAAIPMVKQLLTGKTLLVRATPFSESAVMFEIDLSKLDSAIAPLRAACKW